MLPVGKNLEAIYATANGQLQGEGGLRPGPGHRLGREEEKGPQTHVKELPRTKRIVGDLPLLRPP